MSDSPQQGEIWLVFYQFYDIPGGKYRPAICIDWNETEQSGIFCKITKRNRSNEDDGDTLLLDWQHEGLKMESTARCSQLQTIPKQVICQRFGLLTDSDLYRVFSKLRDKHPMLFRQTKNE